MQTALLAFQWANFLGSALIVVVAVIVGRRWRDGRVITTFPALWGLFGMAYYSAVLSGRLAPASVLMWGAAHRFMAVALALGFLLVFAAILAAPYPLPGNDDDAE